MYWINFLIYPLFPIFFVREDPLLLLKMTFFCLCWWCPWWSCQKFRIWCFLLSLWLWKDLRIPFNPGCWESMSSRRNELHTRISSGKYSQLPTKLICPPLFWSLPVYFQPLFWTLEVSRGIGLKKWRWPGQHEANKLFQLLNHHLSNSTKTKGKICGLKGRPCHQNWLAWGFCWKFIGCYLRLF